MNRISTQSKTLITLALIVLFSAPVKSGPELVGWLEGAYLQPWGIRLRAKLDTGAKTSALHAERIETFEKNGESWIRFHLPFGERDGFPDGIDIERPLHRQTRIKENNTGGTEERYEIQLDICISGKTYNAEVTLSERSNFNYPLLIGREALAGRFIVDPQQTFLGNRSCPRGHTQLKKKKTKAD